MIVFSGRIHLGFTMFIYVILVGLNEELFPILNPLALAIGSLLPDCDHRKAPMGRIFPLWIFGIKHRGLTHTIYACFVVGVLGYVFVSWQFGLSLFFGYTLHLMMDATTPMGVNFLSLSNKKPT